MIWPIYRYNVRLATERATLGMEAFHHQYLLSRLRNERQECEKHETLLRNEFHIDHLGEIIGQLLGTPAKVNSSALGLG